MTTDQKIEIDNVKEKSTENQISKSNSPLVFISHDTRDADIAELFSKLLSSVSAGVLKSFRSSDRKGSQGIEYGFEWYPEIMKKLDESTDVVCLLTKNSINRPWLLYEAGVAKGKLNTALLGIAIDVPLSQANVGPFAQFQNCANDVDSLSKLVMQLVKRIPNSEPDPDVIKAQVSVFISRTSEITQSAVEVQTQDEVVLTQDPKIAVLFEEIKMMYSELPKKIGRNLRTESRRFALDKIMNPSMLEDFLHHTMRINRNTGMMVVLSLFKNDFPWIYELGCDFLKTRRHKNISDLKKQYYEFREVLEITLSHPLLGDRSEIHYRSVRENYHIIMKFFDRLIYEFEYEYEQKQIVE